MPIDFSCLLAASTFTAANVMKIIYYIKERNREFDWEKYTQLDEEFLEQDWNFRLSKQGLFLSSGFLNAFTWIVLSIPVISMAWLLSRNGKQAIMLNVSIGILAIGGAIVEWLSNLFWMGMYSASKQMVLNFNLDTWLISSGDGLGWKTLEVNHIVDSGFIWFTDAFEWICLTGIFFCTFLSVRKWRMTVDRTSFGARWNGLTLFVSLLSLAEFVAQVLRFEGFRTAGRISLIYGAINRLILIPAWILALGVQLPRAQMAVKHVATNEFGHPDLALMEMSSAVNDVPGSSSNPFGTASNGTASNGDSTNPFSIDDDNEGHPHGQ